MYMYDISGYCMVKNLSVDITLMQVNHLWWNLSFFLKDKCQTLSLFKAVHSSKRIYLFNIV